jgi:hypothetical protein
MGPGIASHRMYEPFTNGHSGFDPEKMKLLEEITLVHCLLHLLNLLPERASPNVLK